MVWDRYRAIQRGERWVVIDTMTNIPVGSAGSMPVAVFAAALASHACDLQTDPNPFPNAFPAPSMN